jgi:membrane protein YdbS with pleckstrin-like domain
MNKLSPKILTVWRVRLTLLAFAPAFALSLRYGAASTAWRVCSGIFVLAFAWAYLFYLPARLKGFSYTCKAGTLVLSSGVFRARTLAIPHGAVQTVAVTSGPLCRFFGLACVKVLAACSRACVPGLPQEQAKALAEELKQALNDKINP